MAGYEEMDGKPQLKSAQREPENDKLWMLLPWVCEVYYSYTTKPILKNTLVHRIGGITPNVGTFLSIEGVNPFAVVVGTS